MSVQLEELSITGEQSNDNWHVGLDCIPDEWAALTNLTKLELRGHSLLNVSSLAYSCRYMTVVSSIAFYPLPAITVSSVCSLGLYQNCVCMSLLAH